MKSNPWTPNIKCKTQSQKIFRQLTACSNVFILVGEIPIDLIRLLLYKECTKSNKKGKHGDTLFIKSIIDKMKPYTEIAIGGR